MRINGVRVGRQVDPGQRWLDAKLCAIPGFGPHYARWRALQRSIYRWAPLITVPIAGLLFVLAVVHHQHDIPHGVTVDGQVVEVTTEISNGSVWYRTVVEYDAGGLHRVVDRVATQEEPAVGELRRVSYEPAKPAEGEVLDPDATSFTFVLAGLGVLVLLLGMATFGYRNWQLRRTGG